MVKLILFFAILSLYSCNENLKKSIDDLTITRQLELIENNEKTIIVVNKDSIIANAIKLKNHLSFHCKKGKRVFRKKKFRLYPILDSNDLKDAQLIIKYNKQLKNNLLIGLYSKIVLVNQKKYLFQEEVGKRLLESNFKREGIILKRSAENSYQVSSIKGESINSEYSKAILSYFNDSINPTYLDMSAFKKHQLISNRYFKNYKVNYFYLNPVTNKIEPILSGLFQSNEKNSSKYEIIGSQNSNEYLDFFRIDSSHILTLKNKTTTLNKRILIPNNFKVQLKKGESIDLINNAAIVSYSPFSINGSKEDPVNIFSSDNTGRGIHIIQNEKASNIDFLNFENQFSYFDSSNNHIWSLPSSFTVYGGKVDIYNSRFTKLKSEDAINLFRTKYVFNNSKIDGTFSDAFDADFSFGNIDNSTFMNCGNDGVDISGGEVKLSNCNFDDIKDKAINAGEESKLSSYNCRINNAELAFISKDLSIASSENNFFSNCEVVYCTFQKKGEFGPGSILAKNDSLKNCSLTHLIEYRSSLNLDEKKINVFEVNVKDYLYGKKYGKATIK